MICPKCGRALEALQGLSTDGTVEVVIVYCSNEQCDYEAEVTPAPNPKPAEPH